MAGAVHRAKDDHKVRNSPSRPRLLAYLLGLGKGAADLDKHLDVNDDSALSRRNFLLPPFSSPRICSCVARRAQPEPAHEWP